MYINKNSYKKFIEDRLDNLNAKLKTDVKTLFSLLDSDTDWAFFIQINAFAELLLSNGLKAYFQENSLDSTFEKLPLFNSSYGKTYITRSVGLISKEHEKFLQSVAEIRNKVAHDFNALDFSLDQYVSSMDKNKRTAFIKHVSFMGDEFMPLYEEKPRLVFILNLVFMSAHIELGLWDGRKSDDLSNLELECLRDLIGVADKRLFKRSI